MLSENDLKDAAAKAMASLFKDALVDIGKKGSSIYQSFQESFGIAFLAYIDFAVQRYSSVKTLLYKDQPIPLYDFFINPVLMMGNRQIMTSSFEDISAVGKYVIISGTAGCGKSTLMKHLFLDAMKLGEYIPIMFELRLMNQTEKTLIDAIYNMFVRNKFPLDFKHFISSLHSGKYIFFLDGLDELEKTIKEDVVRQILDLADEFDNCHFVLSSRPDNFISWEKFSELRVCPLDKDKALDLIAKAKYDEEVKEKFLEELDSKYYSELKSFASNPLLLTLMLLTFRDNAGIAKRKTSFYEEAFNALYNRHDATKAVYKRIFHSNLSKDEFITIFSCFCIDTYFSGTLSFSHHSLMERLATAQELSRIYFDAQAYLEDLIQSVCMIVPDGLEYIFTHRSFQEYFTAVYISKKSDADQRELSYFIDNSLHHSNATELYSLLFDLSKERFEINFAAPKLAMIIEKTDYGEDSLENSIVKYAQMLFEKVWISSKRIKGEKTKIGIGMSVTPESDVVGMIIFLLSRRKEYSIEQSHERNQYYSLKDDEKAVILNVVRKKYGSHLSINQFLNDPDLQGLGRRYVLAGLEDEYCTLMEIYKAIKQSEELTQTTFRNILKNCSELN